MSKLHTDLATYLHHDQRHYLDRHPASPLARTSLSPVTTTTTMLLIGIVLSLVVPSTWVTGAAGGSISARDHPNRRDVGPSSLLPRHLGPSLLEAADLSCPSSMCTSCPSFEIPLAHDDKDIAANLATFCPQINTVQTRGSGRTTTAPYMPPFQAIAFDSKAMSAAGGCDTQQSSQIAFASDTIALSVILGTMPLGCEKGDTSTTSANDTTTTNAAALSSSPLESSLSNLQSFMAVTGKTPSGYAIRGCEGYSYNGYIPGKIPPLEEMDSAATNLSEETTAIPAATKYPALKDCYSMAQFGVSPSVPCPTCSHGNPDVTIDTYRPALLPTVLLALGLYASLFTSDQPSAFSPPPPDALEIYYHQLVELFPVFNSMDVGGFIAEEPNVTATAPAKESFSSLRNNNVGAVELSSYDAPVALNGGDRYNNVGSSPPTFVPGPAIRSLSPTKSLTLDNFSTTAPTSTENSTTQPTEAAPPTFVPGPVIRTLTQTLVPPETTTTTEPPPTFVPGPTIRTLTASKTQTSTRLVRPADGFNNTALIASQIGVLNWAVQVGRFRPPSDILRKFIVDRQNAILKVICEVREYPTLRGDAHGSRADLDIPSTAIPYSLRIQTSSHDEGFFVQIDSTTYDAFTQFMAVATLGYFSFMALCPNPDINIVGVDVSDRPLSVLLSALNDLMVWGNVGTQRWVLGLGSTPGSEEVDVEITAMSLMGLSEVLNDLTVQAVASKFTSTATPVDSSSVSGAHKQAAEDHLQALRGTVRQLSQRELTDKLTVFLSGREVQQKMGGSGEDRLGSLSTVLQHLLTWEAILQASPLANTQYRTCQINPTAYFPATTNNTFGGLYGLFNMRETGTNIPATVAAADPSFSSSPPRSSISSGFTINTVNVGSTPLSPSRQPITTACKSSFVSLRATAMWMVGLGQGNFFTARRGIPQNIAPTPSPTNDPSNNNNNPSFFDLHRETVIVVSASTGSIVILGSVLAIAVQVYRGRRSKSEGFYDSALDVEGVRESHYTAATEPVNVRRRGDGGPTTPARNKYASSTSAAVSPNNNNNNAVGTPSSNPTHPEAGGGGRVFGSSRSDVTGATDDEAGGGLGFF